MSSKDPDEVIQFVTELGPKVAFGYSPVWVEIEKRWYYWFVLNDLMEDVPSAKL